jgi:hypothetical protein
MRWLTALGVAALLLKAAPVHAKSQCDMYLQMDPAQRVSFVAGVVEGVRWTAFDLFQVKRKSESFDLDSTELVDLLGTRYEKTVDRLASRVTEMTQYLTVACQRGQDDAVYGRLVVALAHVIREVVSGSTAPAPSAD